MRIAIIDADLIGRKRHRFPNLVCMKLSGFYKEQGALVHLKLDYEALQEYEKVYISKVFTDTPVPSEVLDGKYNWQASTLDSMLRNEKYMGDAILQKSYTADFLSKRRVINDGSVQMYHIEEDHEPIIDIETWKAVQAELERRAQYCKDHFTNAYAQRSEVNPFYAKIICGNCGNIYSRVKYTTRVGTKITKWRCGSIKEFDSELMMAVMDHITVFEDGRLQIKFYDCTEFEVETE